MKYIVTTTHYTPAGGVMARKYERFNDRESAFDYYCERCDYFMIPCRVDLANVKSGGYVDGVEVELKELIIGEGEE